MSCKGWYWCGEMNFFNGIFYWPHGDILPDRYAEEPYHQLKDKKLEGNIHGPFKTFGAAKKDAIDSYKTDIWYARKAITEIKQVKKSKI